MVPFEVWLLTKGRVSKDDMMSALARRGEATPPLGRLAFEFRLLRMSEVFRILNLQTLEGLTFAAAAQRLGLLSEGEVRLLVAAQQRARPSLGRLLVEARALTPAEHDAAHRDYLDEVSRGGLDGFPSRTDEAMAVALVRDWLDAVRWRKFGREKDEARDLLVLRLLVTAEGRLLVALAMLGVTPPAPTEIVAAAFELVSPTHKPRTPQIETKS
jgi:hypothetical protein